MNDPKSKFIAYSSLLTLLLGILTSIIFNFYTNTIISSWISYIYLLKPLSLQVMHLEGPFNVWEIIIYFVLFLGTVFT
jgi:hypothetical protein